MQLHTKINLEKQELRFGYASKDQNSDSMSVLWVYASTAERMKKAYQEIAKEAWREGADNPTVNDVQLMRQWFEDDHDSGNWILIIDNADDQSSIFWRTMKTLAGSQADWLISFLGVQSCWLPAIKSLE